MGKGPEQKDFPKKTYKWSTSIRKGVRKSLMIGKMKIKTHMKHYFTSVRIVDKKDKVTNFTKL